MFRTLMQSLFQMKNVHYLSHPWYLDTLEINTGSMHKYEFGFECLCLFQTFFIFWPSFPSLRDLQSRLKIELFENGRLADFYCWHIWMLHLHLVEPHLTIVNLCINQGLDFYCANFVATSDIMQTCHTCCF